MYLAYLTQDEDWDNSYWYEDKGRWRWVVAEIDGIVYTFCTTHDDGNEF